MEFTIRLEVLPGGTVAEKVRAAKNFGFSGIALPGRFMTSWLDGLRDGFRDLELPVASLSLGFVESLVSPSETKRGRCRDSLLELLDLCAEFEIGRFNLPPCLVMDNDERFPKDAVQEQDDLLLAQLPKLGDEAAARGVLLLIEPVNQYESDYLNLIEHAARLVGKMAHPNIAVTADFFHMQMEELQPADALLRAGKTVKHVHVAENTRVEPGPGSLDFAPGFAALKTVGYDGVIEIECRWLSGPAETVLPTSVSYLRELWEMAAI